MQKKLLYLFPFLALIICQSLSNIALADDAGYSPEDLSRMSLQDLMNIKVITASNISEKKAETPARVIVMTKEEIIQRGYTDLSQIFEDLPGMEVIRVNGDISFKNYMRGFRNSFGTPYLLMLDGMVWTDLYYNDSEVIRAWPVSNIERVEIVYGPASAVYGANAFTGVINVITRKSDSDPDKSLSGNISMGSMDRRAVDLNYLWSGNNISLSLTTRLETSDDFPENNNEYEWAKSKYYKDASLWGGFTESDATGALTSLNQHKALDGRLKFGDMELGGQFYELHSGYSTQYSADKVLAATPWTKQDYTAYIKYNKQINDYFRTSTIARYFASDVPNSSALAQGFNTVNEFGDTVRLINYEYWQTLNSSYSVYQDFHYIPTDKLQLTAGLKFEQKDLQMRYDISSGILLEPDSLQAGSYRFPEPPVATDKRTNRTITEETGLYVNAKYKLYDEIFLHAGLRYDLHSVYGNATSLRLGYIQQLGDLNFKILYGEGYQAPSPRVLWGAWNGLGSEPDLKPEESRTYEINIEYIIDNLLQGLNIYYVNYYNTILNYSDGGRNVGTRNVAGIDYVLRYKADIEDICDLHIWGIMSYIYARGDEIFMENGEEKYREADIGDIAPYKAFIGFTAVWNKYLSTTIQARYMAERNTVSSNPVNSVDDYFLCDANIRLTNLISESFSIALRFRNIFDQRYFHPGIRTADAGITPGYYSNNGVWNGSQGWLASLLPQPGIRWNLSLEYNL